MEIVNFYYNLARENKRLKSFVYGKAYDKVGAGNNAYPLLWLDDPITGGNANEGGTALRWQTNFDVLGKPDSVNDVLAVQTAAFEVGLNLIEYIKKNKKIYPFTVDDFSFISLRDYYDDAAAGFRFTLALLQTNPVDRCADDFDPTKQFTTAKPLPDFSTQAPEGCAIFNDTQALPNFEI